MSEKHLEMWFIAYSIVRGVYWEAGFTFDSKSARVAHIYIFFFSYVTVKKHINPTPQRSFELFLARRRFYFFLYNQNGKDKMSFFPSLPSKIVAEPIYFASWKAVGVNIF